MHGKVIADMNRKGLKYLEEIDELTILLLRWVESQRGQEERGGGEGSLNPHQGEGNDMSKEAGIPTKGIETAIGGRQDRRRKQE